MTSQYLSDNIIIAGQNDTVLYTDEIDPKAFHFMLILCGPAHHITGLTKEQFERIWARKDREIFTNFMHAKIFKYVFVYTHIYMYIYVHIYISQSLLSYPQKCVPSELFGNVFHYLVSLTINNIIYTPLLTKSWILSTNSTNK